MLRRHPALGASALVVLCLMLSMLTASSAAWAQETVPATTADTLVAVGTGFGYQGELQDSNGPMTGTCDFRFALHDALTGGNQVGGTQTLSNVAVTAGRFSVVLNGNSEFGGNAFQGDARWLLVSVRCPASSGEFNALSPRQELLPAPYAVYAASAPWAGLAGVPADLVDGDADTTYSAGAGLTLSSGEFSAVFGGTGAANTVARSDHSHPWNEITGIPADIADGDADTTYAAGNGLTLNSGVFAAAFDGTGVANTVARSDHNHGGQNWIGSSTYGLRVQNTSTAAGADGLIGFAESTSGAGVHGVNTAASGYTRGVFGSSDSVDGVGVSGLHSPSTGMGSGVYGSTSSTVGMGVSGYAAATSGANVGVFGSTSSAVGTGVTGFAGATSGMNKGVSGFTSSVNGRGVNGYAAATSGVNVGVFGESASTTGTGVVGIASATSGLNVGVYGSTNSSAGWAGYFGGDVNITGTLYAPGKSFRIDYPLDPENKYLNHASVESSEMLNVYSGNITLDANGEAWVQLPDWFEALNTDFRYQLTPIGAPGPNLYIAQPVQNNQFMVAGGAAGMVVSWQVSGVRHDPFATAHPLIVVQDKPIAAEEVFGVQGASGQPGGGEAEYRTIQERVLQMHVLNVQSNDTLSTVNGQEGN